MAAIKIAFCLIFVVTFIYAEDVGQRSGQNIFLAQYLEKSIETRASVVETNLSASDASAVANDVQQTYNTVTGALNRALSIQKKLYQRFPSVNHNVIINYQAYAFYQKYYAVVSVNGDTVLCFGS